MPFLPDTVIVLLHNPATGLYYPAVYNHSANGFYIRIERRRTGVPERGEAFRIAEEELRTQFIGARVIESLVPWDGGNETGRRIHLTGEDLAGVVQRKRQGT